MRNKILKNETNNTRSAILSSIKNDNNNYINQITEKKDYKSRYQNDNSIINSSNCKGFNDNNFENIFLKNLIQNLFDYVSEQNTYNKFESFPMLIEKVSKPYSENLTNYNNSNHVILLNNCEEKLMNEIDSQQNILNNISINLNNICKNKNNDDLGKLNSSISDRTNIFKMKDDLNKNNSINENRNNITKNILNFNEKNIAKSGNKPIMETIKTRSKNTNQIIINNTNNVVENKDFNHMDIKSKIPDDFNNYLNNCLYQKNNFESNNQINTLNSMPKNNLSCEIVNRSKIESSSRALEEDKLIFLKSYKSPNPFEDYSFRENFNIFNSPYPSEGLMYKNSNEFYDKMNFNFDMTRNSSVDFNEIFKTENPDNFKERKISLENIIVLNDLFFSTKSNEIIADTYTDSIKVLNDF